MEWQDWRIINDEWHYIEHFPHATRYGSLCGLYKAYGLLDQVSERIPQQGNLCHNCCVLLFQQKDFCDKPVNANGKCKWET